MNIVIHSRKIIFRSRIQAIIFGNWLALQCDQDQLNWTTASYTRHVIVTESSWVLSITNRANEGLAAVIRNSLLLSPIRNTEHSWRFGDVHMVCVTLRNMTLCLWWYKWSPLIFQPFFVIYSFFTSNYFVLIWIFLKKVQLWKLKYKS